MADLRESLDQLHAAIDDLPEAPSAEQISPLEAQAKELLAQSKNTPFEDEARELFSRLSRLSASVAPSPELAQVRGLLRRARIRIEIAGDDQDFDEAIDILAQALDLAPENPEVQDLLSQAAARSPQHALKVQGLMERYSLSFDRSPAAEAPPTPEQALPAEPQPAEEAPPPGKPVPPVQPETSETPSPAAAPTPSSTSETQLSDIASAYYAGDYPRTVELANQLLAREAENEQAIEYRQKASDNIMRGIVPDHRIPFDARVAYNRANSLVRAGNYDEAQRLYREAREIAEQAGIQSWKDVEQALLEIQDLALARELLADGDRLLAADDWPAALAKYEGALRVVPNDPEAEERVALVKRIQEQFDQTNVQLNMMSGSLIERANNLTQLYNSLMTFRQTLPNSERLRQIVEDTQSRMQNIKTQLISQGQGALTRLESNANLDEKMRVADDAVALLTAAVELDPSDARTSQVLEQAAQTRTNLSEARQTMDQASALIARNDDSGMAQARQMLTGLRVLAQDPRYRSLVDELLNRHLERVEIAIDNRDLTTADHWLSMAKEEPFRMLGRRTEILRLEGEMRSARQSRWLTRGVLVAIVLVVLFAVAFLTRDAWEETVFPPDPTDRPTALPVALRTGTTIAEQTSAAATQEAAANATATAETRSAGQTATFEALNATASEERLNEIITLTSIAGTQRAKETQNVYFTQTAALTTPTATLTPSQTPTSTRTPTPTLTITPTPTIPTRTPSITPSPTPEILCIIRNDNSVNVTIRSARILSQETVLGQIRPGDEAEVLEVADDPGGADYNWYEVSYTRPGTDFSVSGWVRADVVIQVSICPELEEE
jgi:tetratricopeptide (TPR) repeat protein